MHERGRRNRLSLPSGISVQRRSVAGSGRRGDSWDFGLHITTESAEQHFPFDLSILTIIEA